VNASVRLVRAMAWWGNYALHAWHLLGANGYPIPFLVPKFGAGVIIG